MHVVYKRNVASIVLFRCLFKVQVKTIENSSAKGSCRGGALKEHVPDNLSKSLTCVRRGKSLIARGASNRKDHCLTLLLTIRDILCNLIASRKPSIAMACKVQGWSIVRDVHQECKHNHVKGVVVAIFSQCQLSSITGING